MYEAIQNILTSAGNAAPTDVGANDMFGAPSLDALTLNPSILPGGIPPQIPYAPGGPQMFQSGLNVTPYAPGAAPEGAIQPSGGPAQAGGSTFADKLNAFSKVLKGFGGLQKSLEDPLASQMFQEHQQRTMAQNQMQQGKIEQFRRNDLSSQILEKYGLL